MSLPKAHAGDLAIAKGPTGVIRVGNNRGDDNAITEERSKEKQTTTKGGSILTLSRGLWGGAQTPGR